jgi:hypothetical protein
MHMLLYMPRTHCAERQTVTKVRRALILAYEPYLSVRIPSKQHTSFVIFDGMWIKQTVQPCLNKILSRWVRRKVYIVSVGSASVYSIFSVKGVKSISQVNSQPRLFATIHDPPSFSATLSLSPYLLELTLAVTLDMS